MVFVVAQYYPFLFIAFKLISSQLASWSEFWSKMYVQRILYMLCLLKRSEIRSRNVFFSPFVSIKSHTSTFSNTQLEWSRRVKMQFNRWFSGALCKTHLITYQSVAFTCFQFPTDDIVMWIELYTTTKFILLLVRTHSYTSIREIIFKSRKWHVQQITTTTKLKENKIKTYIQNTFDWRKCTCYNWSFQVVRIVVI